MFCAISLPILGGVLIVALAIAVLTYRRMHSVSAAVLAGVVVLIVSATVLMLFLWLRRLPMR
jgi:hypothetical protein